MQTASENGEITGSELDGAAFSSAWEHMAAELRLFDAHVYLATLRRQQQLSGRPDDPYRSITVTEEEARWCASSMIGAWDDQPGPVLTGEAARVEEVLCRLQEKIWQCRILSNSQGQFLPLDYLSGLFGLTRSQEFCLIMCLAADLDRRYQRLFGYLQDDLTRNRPSVSLVFDLLDLPVSERVAARTWLCAESPLIRHQLLRVTAPPGDANAPFVNRFLQIDERVANFLLGIDSLDARILSFANWGAERASDRTCLTQEAKRLRDYVQRASREYADGAAPACGIAINLTGADEASKQSIALQICRAAGKRLLLVNTKDALAGNSDLSSTLWRESALTGAAIFFQHADRSCLWTFAEQPGMLTFLSSSQQLPATVAGRALFFPFPVQPPSEVTRRELWRQRLDALGHAAAQVDLTPLSSQFRLTATQIGRAAEQAVAFAQQRQAEGPELQNADLYAACRAQVSPNLGTLARQVERGATWNDVVLPANQAAQLRAICGQVRYSNTVYGEWGFARGSSLGKGVNVLFTGSPGTGKTLSAEIIANELGLELYKIDLSQVFSKYVGDTEKNISCIFDEAEDCNAILFFDEADTMFGKRSEVKDAQDRYANMETGFLLQRMEEYSGVSILATNLRKNMDDAMVRRLHFIVEFPLPDEGNRLAIWRKQIPASAPVEALDLPFLARRFALAGGHIRNISLGAAFLAASENAALGMRHLLFATMREFEKMGRQCAPSEFGEYAPLVQARHHEAVA